MIEMIRRIFVLAGDRRKTLLTAVVLNILQNCCTGGMYLFVMAAIVSLVDGTFGMGTLLQCSLCMAGLLVLRYALEYQVTSFRPPPGTKSCGTCGSGRAGGWSSCRWALFRRNGWGA